MGGDQRRETGTADKVEQRVHHALPSGVVEIAGWLVGEQDFGIVGERADDRNALLFAAEIYFFTRIPARIDSGEVAAVVIMALALSFLATLYPSWRAARLDPVEALRYE